LTQFILFPKPHRLDKTCGIHTLETACYFDPPLLEQGRFGIKCHWHSESNQATGGDHMYPPDQSLGEPTNGRMERFRLRRRKPWGVSERTADLENGGHKTSTATNTFKIPSNFAGGQDSPGTMSATTFPTELRHSAPNVQLNLPNTVLSHSKSITEHKYAAAFAVLVQMSVILVSAFTTFHPWAISKMGKSETMSGFHCSYAGHSVSIWQCYHARGLLSAARESIPGEWLREERICKRESEGRCVKH